MPASWRRAALPVLVLTRNPSSMPYRRDVEGLRAVAVLAVLLYHARLGPLGGYVGVDVFYVLSGFLITGLLRREVATTGRIALVAFYARRARRLLPAALVVLLVTLGVSLLLLSPLRARPVLGDAVAVALYVGNYRFALLGTDYLGDAAPSPLQHYWSLGVEEQFYLLWPVLLLLVRRARRPAASLAVLAVGAGSLAVCAWLASAAPPWAFFSLPARAWELTAGATVALAAERGRQLPSWLATPLGWIGLLTIVASVLLLGGATPFPWPTALLPVAGTAAVLLAGASAPRGGAQVLLGRGPLQLTGRLSYPWYLWHWPLIVLVPEAFGHPLPPVGRLLIVLGSGLLAALTVVLVENPVRFARWLRSPVRGLALGGALSAGAVFVAAGSAAVLPPVDAGPAVPAPAPLAPSARAATPLPARPQRSAPPGAEARVTSTIAQAVTIRTLPANLLPSLEQAHQDDALPFLDGCNLAFLDSRQPACGYGDVRSPTRVVAFGDSHAAQWFPALRAAAEQHNWRLESLSKSTCPPLDVPIFSPVLRRPFTECVRWRRAVLARLASERPALVVLGVARHYGPEYTFRVYGRAWLTALGSTVRQLRANGSQVLVLGPTPKPEFDEPDCLAAHPRDLARCTPSRALAVNEQGTRAEQAVVQAAGGTYLDVSPWVCTSHTCAVVVGNLLVFRDDNHLSTAFTRWLAPVLGARLQRALKPTER